MEHRGRNWENVAAKQEVEQRMAEHAQGAGPGEHAEGHEAH